MHNPESIPKNVYVWDHIPDFKRKADLCMINPEQWSNEGQMPSPQQVDKMVRVVLYLCSPQSPYYEETDYKTRLEYCITAAGIQANAAMAAMIRDHHWWFLRVVNAYMMLYSGRLFSEWLAARVALFDMFKVLMQSNMDAGMGIKDMVKAKRDAQTAIEDFSARVDSIESRLFPMSDLAQASFRQAIFDLENVAEQYADVWSGF